MKLIFQPYSDEDVALIRTAVRQNAENSPEINAGFQTDIEKGMLISVPHKVYHLNSKDIIYEKGLRCALLNGKQYLLLLGENVIGSAEIVNVYGNEKSIRLNFGSFYRSLAEVISLVEEHQTAGDYEFNILKIPSIYVIAVWLRSVNKNLFIPFGNIPKEYQPLKLYNEEDFLRPAKRLSLINIRL
ncbi:MAG: hypothetical protein ACJ76F_11620 [Bacteroidia bacterium]